MTTGGHHHHGQPGQFVSHVFLITSRDDWGQSISAHFSGPDFRVTTASPTDDIAARIASDTPQLVLVEHLTMMSKIVESIRQLTAVPIIALTPRNTPRLRIAAFDAGADDSMSLGEPLDDDPLSLDELGRRVRAVLRRAIQRSADVIYIGPEGVILRPRSHEVLVDGVPVPLTPREFAVLRALLERRGEVLTPDEISAQQWGHTTFGDRNFVEAHISRVRAKLRAAGARDVITTVRGIGYRVP